MKKLLFLFALVMIAVGVLMLRRKDKAPDEAAGCENANTVKVGGFGLAGEPDGAE